MNELTIFYNEYGIALTICAIIGIILLGILKYCNIFAKIEDKTRHYIYIALSVTLSLVLSGIYLFITHTFDIKLFLLFASNVYALNQTFYNLFKTFSVNELFSLLLNKILRK